MSDYNIGNIYAELSMDISSLEVSKRKAIKELGKLRDEGDKILKEAGGKMTEAMKIRLDEIEKNKSAVLKSIDDLNKQIREKLNSQKEVLGLQIESIFMQPLKAFASSSVDTFSQFQQSMQNTFSVMGASANEMKLLEDTAKKMGETTRFSASQASQALYSLGSAGQSASEAVNSLQGVLRLAGATGSELAYTSETIASTLSQFNLEASKASHIADVYAKAISKSQANITKLSYSMKYVGPVASGLGISLETTTAALMKLYNTGYGGEQAGTYLKQAFQKLASGTEELKNKLQKLGLSYGDVNPQTRNFADIINTLKEKNIGVTESIAIFGETAGGAMAKLIEEGGDAIATMEGLLKSSEGAATEMQEIQNASFANTKAELMSAMEALQITTGSILEPALNVLAKGFAEVLKSVNGLPIGIQTFITTMLTASTAIVPFLTMPALITRIKKAMDFLNVSMLKNPIFIGGAVLATLASIAYSYHQSVKKHNEEMVREATKGVEDIKEMYKKAHEAGEKGRNIQGLLSQYETLKDKTNKTKEEQEAYNKTLKDLQNLVPGVVTEVGKTGDAYIENIDKIKLANEKYSQEEKTLNLQAREITQQRYANALAVQGMYKEKAAQLKIDEENFKAKDSTKQMKAMIEEINKLSNEADIDKVLFKYYGNEEIVGRGNNTTSLSLNREQRIKKYEKEFATYMKDSNDLLARKDEIFKVDLEVKKLFKELNELDSKIDPPKIKEEPKIETPKQTKNEILESYQKQREDTLNKLKKDQKDLRLQINILDEEENLLRADLKKLFSLDVSNIKEGEVFTSDDEGIKKIHARIDKIRAMKTNGKEGIKTEKEEKQIKEIEEKTAYSLEQARQEYEKKKAELWEVLTHLHNAKAELDQLKTKDDKTSFDEENINFLKREIDSLQDKAKSLSTELGKDYVLLDDIDNKIAEMEQKDSNSFKAKFKAIEAQKEATIAAINKAQSAGNIDEKTAQAKIKKINDVALKSTITVGAELSKTILSVGNNVTDIILNAIEKGELSLENSLNAVVQIAGQLAGMIPDPMTKAIIGAVSMGFSLINKIVSFAENKAKEAEEKENKRREDERRESQEHANKLAGETAIRIAKQTQAVKSGFVNYNKMMDEMSDKLQQNKINETLKNMGNSSSLFSEDREGVRAIEEGWFFGLGKKVIVGWEKYSYEYKFTINELAEKIKKAKEEGNIALEKKLKDIYKKSIEANLKKNGIDPRELDGFHNYLQGLENVFVDAVKNKDFENLRLAMKEKIREAMWAKLQQSIILSKLKPLFMELESAGHSQKEAIIKKIMKESEIITKELDGYAKKVFGELGGVSSELEEHQKAWIGLKTSITAALSNSLEESAYNADWASFKKAFASEMKKAIIRATVKNAGFKTNVDEIIKDIMKDGQITEDEVNESINKLQNIFDGLEGKLAPLAKITKALEGGVDVNSKHQGTIIQQLSGADRDFFAEEFRKNFASMGDTFKNAMIDLKEIHQAQITVQMATLKVNDIYINAESALDLKELIAQMIEEARKAG